MPPLTLVGSLHLQLGKFVFSDAKRLSRQRRSKADIGTIGFDRIALRHPGPYESLLAGRSLF
jgi:hypothetical protein